MLQIAWNCAPNSSPPAPFRQAHEATVTHLPVDATSRNLRCPLVCVCPYVRLPYVRLIRWPVRSGSRSCGAFMVALSTIAKQYTFRTGVLSDAVLQSGV